MNHEETELNPVGDEKIEARIISWVLGQASAFEAEELEKMCAESPEWRVFYRRMLAIHGSLIDVAEDAPSPQWRLSPERREKLNVILGEPAKVAPLVTLPKRKLRWQQFAKIAALIIVLYAIASLATFTLAPNKKASEATVVLSYRSNAPLQVFGDKSPPPIASFGKSASKEAGVHTYERMEAEKLSSNTVQKPSAPSSSSAKVIAAIPSSNVTIPIPEVDVPSPSTDFGNGDDFGVGWGSGDTRGGSGGGGPATRIVAGSLAIDGDLDYTNRGEAKPSEKRSGELAVEGAALDTLSDDVAQDGAIRRETGQITNSDATVVDGKDIPVVGSLFKQKSEADEVQEPQSGKMAVLTKKPTPVVPTAEDTRGWGGREGRGEDVGGDNLAKNPVISPEAESKFKANLRAGSLRSDSEEPPELPDSIVGGRSRGIVANGAFPVTPATPTNFDSESNGPQKPQSAAMAAKDEKPAADPAPAAIAPGAQDAFGDADQLASGGLKGTKDLNGRSNAEMEVKELEKAIQEQSDVVEEKRKTRDNLLRRAPSMIADNYLKMSDGEDAIVEEGKKEIEEKEQAKMFFELEASQGILAAVEPYSTFSLHVSDASFKLANAALAAGQRPAAESVRREEFYNAFDYGDPLPSGKEPVACAIDQSAHPFAASQNLLRISMRTAAAGRSAGQPLHLTLLIDQSGSMNREDRSEVMEASIKELTTLLTANDKVSIIGFSRTPRLLGENIAGNDAANLRKLILQAPSDGGTNMEEALNLGEVLATRNKANGAQNRILLVTDGAANLGNANPERLANHIKVIRQKGLAFDIAGIGTDGLNDEMLLELSRHGNGRYYVVNNVTDAKENFARQLAGAFRPAAENVKVQVQLNPQRVKSYSLLGFEKDRLKTEDFRNDKVDAAELAAAEAGNAMYQLALLPEGSGDIGEVSVRFRDTATGEMVERKWTILYDANTPPFDLAQPSMQLAGMALFTAEKLRGGVAGQAVNFDDLSKSITTIRNYYQQSERVAQLIVMTRVLSN